MITAKQQLVLDCIHYFIDEHTRQPTLSEISFKLGVGESGIHKHVRNLIDAGYLYESQGKAAYSVPNISKDTAALPFMGVIAAGRPIEAIPDIQSIDLAKSFCGPDRYVLRITGDSMIEAGLLDGDYVVVQKQLTAKRGDAVVALVDRSEATLKYYHPVASKGFIELRPANASMKPMVYESKRVDVQGVVVGSFRQY
jgi:repressor LexA